MGCGGAKKRQMGKGAKMDKLKNIFNSMKKKAGQVAKRTAVSVSKKIMPKVVGSLPTFMNASGAQRKNILKNLGKQAVVMGGQELKKNLLVPGAGSKRSTTVKRKRKHFRRF